MNNMFKVNMGKVRPLSVDFVCLGNKGSHK